MLKRLILPLLLVSVTMPLFAESKEHRNENRHMLRIGWGDQQFEHLAWHATPKPVNNLPASYHAVYDENFRYVQHWFVEYQNRHNFWFSYGGMVDGSGVVWDQVTRNGEGTELSRVNNRSFYNIIIMPTIYFTYFHHQYVSLYSGLGVGMDINGGTEVDFKGRTTVVAPALNLTLFSVSAWYDRWFASFELGAMAALTDGQHIYLLGSRVFSLSIGATF